MVTLTPFHLPIGDPHSSNPKDGNPRHISGRPRSRRVSSVEVWSRCDHPTIPLSPAKFSMKSGVSSRIFKNLPAREGRRRHPNHHRREGFVKVRQDSSVIARYSRLDLVITLMRGSSKYQIWVSSLIGSYGDFDETCRISDN